MCLYTREAFACMPRVTYMGTNINHSAHNRNDHKMSAPHVCTINVCESKRFAHNILCRQPNNKDGRHYQQRNSEIRIMRAWHVSHNIILPELSGPIFNSFYMSALNIINRQYHPRNGFGTMHIVRSNFEYGQFGV